MNRVVVIGAIIAIVLAASVIGILAVNHQNSNYTPTTTMTNNGSNVTLNANTTTSTMTSTMPTTSTTTNISYNTFYFLNETNQKYYYIFVLSYDEYETLIKYNQGLKITYVLFNLTEYVGIEKDIVVGNYAYLIGYTSTPLNVSIGHQYLVEFIGGIKSTHLQFTYEGNWTGPIP